MRRPITAALAVTLSLSRVGGLRRPAHRLDVRFVDVERHAPAQLRRAGVRRGGLLAGAQPDWGPAGVPAAAGTPGDPPETPPRTTTDAQKRPALALTLPKGSKLRSVLRKGLAVAVKSGAAGRVTVTAKSKRSKLGSGAAKVGASGKAQGAAVRRSVSLTLKR